MLPGLNLPVSLLGLLGALRPVFTGPSFVTFCGLVAGLAGQVRRRWYPDAEIIAQRTPWPAVPGRGA